MGKRARWWIAGQLNRLRGQCWAGLVTWALGASWHPWRPVTSTCRDDLARNGTCYCGKLRGVDYGAVRVPSPGS